MKSEIKTLERKIKELKADIEKQETSSMSQKSCEDQLEKLENKNKKTDEDLKKNAKELIKLQRENKLKEITNRRLDEDITSQVNLNQSLNDQIKNLKKEKEKMEIEMKKKCKQFKVSEKNVKTLRDQLEKKLEKKKTKRLESMYKKEQLPTKDFMKKIEESTKESQKGLLGNLVHLISYKCDHTMAWMIHDLSSRMFKLIHIHNTVILKKSLPVMKELKEYIKLKDDKEYLEGVLEFTKPKPSSVWGLVFKEETLEVKEIEKDSQASNMDIKIGDKLFKIGDTEDLEKVKQMLKNRGKGELKLTFERPVQEQVDKDSDKKKAEKDSEKEKAEKDSVEQVDKDSDKKKAEKDPVNEMLTFSFEAEKLNWGLDIDFSKKVWKVNNVKEKSQGHYHKIAKNYILMKINGLEVFYNRKKALDEYNKNEDSKLTFRHKVEKS